MQIVTNVSHRYNFQQITIVYNNSIYHLNSIQFKCKTSNYLIM